MNRIAKIALLLLLPFYCKAQYDSSFIVKARAFIIHQYGDSLKGHFYTQWDSDTQAQYFIYPSLKNRIATPNDTTLKGMAYNFFATGHDKIKADSIYSSLEHKGYDAFIYKTFASSNTTINKRFMAYPQEAQCFIMFHELLHNFIARYNPNLPYEFNEAACDLMGTYGTLEYTLEFHPSWEMDAYLQGEWLERLYGVFNRSISQINSGKEEPKVVNAYTSDYLQKHLNMLNLHQRDRFDFPVNNAYFLKNNNYSGNYFLLKKVFAKKKTVKAFVEFLRTLPSDSKECRKILE